MHNWKPLASELLISILKWMVLALGYNFCEKTKKYVHVSNLIYILSNLVFKSNLI